jgi:single-strand DNA-binding protein
MIKLLVIGNLGKDCVTREVNGKNVMNFNVAHSEKYKDNTGNLVEKTTWVECSYWSDRVAIAPYLKKGTTVYVEGTPEVRAYTTNDGRQGASLQLRVLNIQLVGGSGNRNSEDNGASASPAAMNSSTGNSNYTPANESNAPVDDLPF